MNISLFVKVIDNDFDEEEESSETEKVKG